MILASNVECVLLGRNCNFLGGYLVVSARYPMVTTGYCYLAGGSCSLLMVTAFSHFFTLAQKYNAIANHQSSKNLRQ